MDKDKKERKEDCPCTWDCPRHGDCDACKANHHPAGEMTSCEKLEKQKKG